MIVQYKIGYKVEYMGLTNVLKKDGSVHFGLMNCTENVLKNVLNIYNKNKHIYNIYIFSTIVHTLYIYTLFYRHLWVCVRGYCTFVLNHQTGQRFFINPSTLPTGFP